MANVIWGKKSADFVAAREAQKRLDDPEHDGWAETVDWSFCERCLRRFIVKNGNSGRFCSRQCYAPGPMRRYKTRPAFTPQYKTANATWPELLAAELDRHDRAD